MNELRRKLPIICPMCSIRPPAPRYFGGIRWKWMALHIYHSHAELPKKGKRNGKTNRS